MMGILWYVGWEGCCWSRWGFWFFEVCGDNCFGECDFDISVGVFFLSFTLVIFCRKFIGFELDICCILGWWVNGLIEDFINILLFLLFWWIILKDFFLNDEEDVEDFDNFSLLVVESCCDIGLSVGFFRFSGFFKLSDFCCSNDFCLKEFNFGMFGLFWEWLREDVLVDEEDWFFKYFVWRNFLNESGRFISKIKFFFKFYVE